MRNAKREMFEYCLYLMMSRFKYKDRLEQTQNRLEDAQHDDDLIEASIGDFVRAMEKLKLISFEETPDV